MGSIYVLKLFTEASATKLFVATYVQNPFYVVAGAGPVVIVFTFFCEFKSCSSAHFSSCKEKNTESGIVHTNKELTINRFASLTTRMMSDFASSYLKTNLEIQILNFANI